MPPGVAIRPSAVAHRRSPPPQISAGCDAVHDRRVAGLADADDAAVLDADVALDDAEHRIDHHGVADHHVERARGAVVAGGEPHAVAQRLAAAVQALVARDRVSRARSRPAARCRRAGRASPVVGPYMRGVVADGDILPICFRLRLKPRSRGAAQRLFLDAPARRARTVGQAVEAVDLAGAAEGSRASTSLLSPGSKRTAVPAGMSSRMPKAAPRSNSSAGLASKKW